MKDVKNGGRMQTGLTNMSDLPDCLNAEELVALQLA